MLLLLSKVSLFLEERVAQKWQGHDQSDIPCSIPLHLPLPFMDVRPQDLLKPSQSQKTGTRMPVAYICAVLQRLAVSLLSILEKTQEKSFCLSCQHITAGQGCLMVRPASAPTPWHARTDLKAVQPIAMLTAFLPLPLLLLWSAFV